jgi:aldose 1-epimerase
LERILLRDGETGAEVVPGAGANCAAFRVGEREAIEGGDSTGGLLSGPASGGCPVLFPFPGRLWQGRYRFDGREYRLPINHPGEGVFIHGFTMRRPWRVEDRTEGSCLCAFDHTMLEAAESGGYPWPFRLAVRWSVKEATLRAGVRVENTGGSDLPFGFGLHPYIAVADDPRIEVSAGMEWPHRAGIPVGQPVVGDGFGRRWSGLSPGDSTLLTGFTGNVVASVGDVEVRFPADRFSEAVIYRPEDRSSVCVEPWTSVAGAAGFIEAGEPHGPLRLASGEVWEAWVEISVNRRAG